MKGRCCQVVFLVSAFIAAGILALPCIGQDIDWEAVETEAATLLSESLRIDTSNPPGEELAAAHFWERVFRAAKLEPHVFETAPGRGGVWVRLPGRTKKGALLLLHHLDVVPARPEEWKHPPFGGVQENGYVYGRGAVDAKGLGVVQALAVLLLHRHGAQPARDVVFVATPDEEAGGKLGAGWFVEKLLPQLGPVAFVLNEGGHIRATPSAELAFEVAVAEKTPVCFRFTLHGYPGHGSTPPAETAVTKLVRALARIVAAAPEVRVTEEVQRYFAALAPFQVGEQAKHFVDLRAALQNEPFRQQFLLEPRQSALVQDTLAVTVIHAGQKTNVIPASETAELDCRLLPGSDPESFVRRVVELVGDPTIQVETLLHFPPSASPTDTVLYQTIEALARKEKGRAVPAVLTGFTDSHYFRERGIPSYGFAPFVLTESDLQGMHGVDERISRANLREGTRRLVELIRELP